MASMPMTSGPDHVRSRGRHRHSGQEVDPAAIRIDGLYADDVRGFGRDRDRFPAVARDGVCVTPPIALAQPQKPLAVIQPIETPALSSRTSALGHVHPRVVPI